MKQNCKILLSLLMITLLLSSCQFSREVIEPLNDYPHWHSRMEKFIAEQDSIKDGSIIFLGNSIIEGFDLEKYFPNKIMINRGIVSDHIDGAIKRLPSCLGDANNVKLFILLGINDIGAKRSERNIKFLYRKLLKEISENYDVEVYLHSIFPTSARWKNCPPQTIRNMNGYIKQLAKRYDMTYIDVYPLFLGDNPDHCNDDLFKDGLHPNDEGYEMWVHLLREYIK
mgnify:CR=1 FL=1